MSGVDTMRIVRAVAKRIHREYYSFNLDLEDLEGEGFLIATEHLPLYDKSKGDDPGTYLYGVVYMRLRNYVSRDLMKHEIDKVPLEYVDSEREVHMDEDAYDLKRARGRMEEIDRKIFDGIKEGLSYREIAEATGTSKSTVSRRIKEWPEKYGGSL